MSVSANGLYTVKLHETQISDRKKEKETGKNWQKHQIDKDIEKKEDFNSKLLKNVCMRECAHACQSRLGHPTLFNVTLTSKPCVQALNADRMEQVFI